MGSLLYMICGVVTANWYYVEHLLFVVSGNNPLNYLDNHLKRVKGKRRKRHAIGIHIDDHADFIKDLFNSL